MLRRRTSRLSRRLAWKRRRRVYSSENGRLRNPLQGARCDGAPQRRWAAPARRWRGAPAVDTHCRQANGLIFIGTDRGHRRWGSCRRRCTEGRPRRRPRFITRGRARGEWSTTRRSCPRRHRRWDSFRVFSTSCLVVMVLLFLRRGYFGFRLCGVDAGFLHKKREIRFRKRC